MSRNTKIVLGVVAAIVVLLCLCACATVSFGSLLIRRNSINTSASRIEIPAGEAVQVNPGQPDMGSQAMPAFTLPDGWRSDYAVRIGNFQLVGYKPDRGTGHLVVIGIPETERADAAKLESELRSLAQSNGLTWSQGEMTVVERRPVTIRDQDTERVISEGRGSSGLWRQEMVYFRGDRGLTLVVFGMPGDSYDQVAADTLFASIH